MILATHAIVGAALASFLPSRPAAAALVGFASHFIVDAIPHWDYPVWSAAMVPNSRAHLKYDRALLRDLVVLASDSLLGILLALWLFASADSRWAIFLGACGAMLPDALQFLHNRFPREPLRSLQRFHVWMHTNQRMEGRAILGVASQLVFVVAVVLLAMAARRSFL